MQLAMMTTECYDGIVIDDPKRRRVRVMWKDMVPASWVTMPENLLAVKHFEQLSEDARAVNVSGEAQVLRSYFKPVPPAQSVPLEDACVIRVDGTITMMMGFKLLTKEMIDGGFGNPLKPITDALGWLTSGKKKEEDTMGDVTNGSKMGEFDCYGTEFDDDGDCKSCTDRVGCKNCFNIIESVKDLPMGVEGIFLNAKREKIISGAPASCAPVYAMLKEATNHCFGRGHVAGTQACSKCGFALACKECEDTGCKDVALVVGERDLGEPVDRTVLAYRQIYRLLEDKVPDIMQHAEGDTVKAVGLLLNGLVASLTTNKSVMADLRGMQDSDDVWEGRERKNDGMFFSRDQNPGVIRKVKKTGVPCDDQSGDDVCADAGRVGFACRGGPR